MEQNEVPLNTESDIIKKASVELFKWKSPTFKPKYFSFKGWPCYLKKTEKYPATPPSIFL